MTSANDRPRTVYPRACGGNRAHSAGNPFDPGLSPRLRGNHVCDFGQQFVKGSIPAPAGEPGAAAYQQSIAKVYPRACGGTGSTVTATPTALGLSPAPAGEPYTRPAAAMK